MRLEPLPRRVWVRAALLAGLLVACVSVFVWLLQETAAGGTRAFDLAVMAWVSRRRSPGLSEIAVNLTALGSRTILTIGTALVFLLLWTGKRRLAAIDTAVACAVAGIITRAVKVLLGRPRPSSLEPLIQVAGFSFPSGHVSGITALLTATALHTIEAAPSRGLRVVLAVLHVLLIAGVGWSRVYLGVHYPSDVVAGLCVGIACALGAHGLLRTRTVVRHLRAWRGGV